MNRVPKVEIKTLPGTADEVIRHLDTEQSEEKKTQKPKRKKVADKAE